MESLRVISPEDQSMVVPENMPGFADWIGYAGVKKTIFSARQIDCGQFSWQMYRSHEELGRGFDDYLNYIPGPVWPLAKLHHIEIKHNFLREGYGRKGVKQFILDAKEQGAVCALLKVGWSSTEWKKEREWKIKFYEFEGFILLENPNPEMADVSDIMYRRLDA